MDEDPLPRVALWVISCFVCDIVGSGLWPYPVGRGIELEAMMALCLFSSSILGGCLQCVRLFCGGPNPLVRGLAALRWCVFEGWCGVAGQYEGRGGAFPACRLFLPCVVLLLAFFPSHPFLLCSCVEWPHAHWPC
ncbi:hypothetical protein TcG_11306 [Trypanosoma cruzi]|nr:hypothetical protein TcG_11306 [Trypanosoma cruzi]